MKYFSSIIFTLFWAHFFFAQSFHFQSYSVGDGLPQSQVYALFHDSRGYLYLGTQGGGLAIFDGKEFQNFSSSNGLSGNYVQAILEDESGDILIGTNNGVSKYDGKIITPFIDSLIPNLMVTGMALGQNDTLFLAAQQGVFLFIDGQYFSQKNKAGKNMGRMWSAFADSKGTIWMGGGNGIFKKEQNATEWEHAWRRKTEVLAFGESKDGRIIAGAFDLGLRIWDGKNWGQITEEDGLPSNRIQSICTAPNGDVWLGTQNAGAAIFNLPDIIGEKEFNFTYLSEKEGLCNKNIRSITGDRWGNIWLGTSGSGVCKYSGQEFEHFTERDGLRSDFIYSMTNDTSGGLWLSAGDQGVSFWTPDSLINYGADNGFYNLKCRTMFRASDGRVWIGTEGAGVATMLEPDTNGVPRFRLINRKKGLCGNWVRDIVEDDEGSLWVATTDGGVGRVKVNDLISGNYNFKNYGINEGLPIKSINQLYFDKKERLWIAVQRRGIFYLENRNDGKVKKIEMPRMTVRSLTEDDRGNLWFGTAGKGIGRFNIEGDTLGDIIYFNTEDGLSSSNIYLLQFDEKNQLWVGSEKGVDRLKFDASGNPVEVRHFGMAEGFRGVEVCQNSSLVDEQGNLWFGTVNGLTKYSETELDTGKLIPPKVHLKSVSLFYEPIEKTDYADFSNSWEGLKKGAIFPYNINHFGFDFFAPNFSNPDAVEYSWQLLNWDKKETPWVKQNGANYANLPPGEYTFVVRAKNEDDVVGKPVKTSFIIETPYWQTTWFKFLSGGMLAIMVVGIFWLRLRRLRKKSAMEKQKLEMENHLLQLEQKARQLQMNPHFIFNALNSIQSLVTRGDNDAARQYILKFGKLMRAVLDNSRKEFISLEKEIDTLGKYLEMEQFCRDGNFDFHIDVKEVESDDLNIPPMLVQPFVENSILHGVAPLKNRRGIIEVIFSENKSEIRVEVKDNGAGMKNKPKIKGERSSAGILVTKERINILGGKIDIKSNEGEGVKVFLSIPINS